MLYPASSILFKGDSDRHCHPGRMWPYQVATAKWLGLGIFQASIWCLGYLESVWMMVGLTRVRPKRLRGKERLGEPAISPHIQRNISCMHPQHGSASSCTIVIKLCTLNRSPTPPTLCPGRRGAQ